MRTRPTIDELRQAIADFEKTADTEAPAYSFYRRVADNLQALIDREESQGPDADAAERARLSAFLGGAGTLEELNARLARAIRAGDIAVDDPGLLGHLRGSARATLAIDNPRYASYQRDIGDD